MEHLDRLEDFWGRRATKPRFSQEFWVFGRSVQLLSNNESLLTAVDHSLPLFSLAPKTSYPPFTVQLVVEPRMKAIPAPEDLMPRITYTGDANWLMLHMGEWGHAFADLSHRWATAVLAPTLAIRPDLISRCLLNTVVLNFCIASGFGMLHASCLYRNGRVLLLLAPHNTGKSTTALRLALSGYQFVSDSMIFVWSDEEVSHPFTEATNGCTPTHPPAPLQLNAFPVGRTKLRADMTAVFPELHPLLTAEIIRDETKYNVDLRRLGDHIVRTEVIYPETVDLYLLSRSHRPETTIKPAEETTVWEAVMMNSLYYDTTAVWEQNLTQLKPLLQRANCYHLAIGTDPKGILSCLGT